MSAMHWEARRRQSALDRRRRSATHSQQLQQKDSDHCGQTEKVTEQPAVEDQCPQCKGQPKAPAPPSAKVPNRYSSLQYTQQW